LYGFFQKYKAIRATDYETGCGQIPICTGGDQVQLSDENSEEGVAKTKIRIWAANRFEQDCLSLYQKIK